MVGNGKIRIITIKKTGASIGGKRERFESPLGQFFSKMLEPKQKYKIERKPANEQEISAEALKRFGNLEEMAKTGSRNIGASFERLEGLVRIIPNEEERAIAMMTLAALATEHPGRISASYFAGLLLRASDELKHIQNTNVRLDALVLFFKAAKENNLHQNLKLELFMKIQACYKS